MRTHYPESEETQKGHVRTIPQGLRSMKKRVEPDGVVESPQRKTKKHQDVVRHVYDLNDEMQGKIYTDQTD